MVQSILSELKQQPIKHGNTIDYINEADMKIEYPPDHDSSFDDKMRDFELKKANASSSESFFHNKKEKNLS